MKSEHKFFITAVKFIQGFYNMILFTTVTWPRIFSLKHSVWINYKYETHAVEKAQQIIFRAPWLPWDIEVIPIFHHIQPVWYVITGTAGTHQWPIRWLGCNYLLCKKLCGLILRIWMSMQAVIREGNVSKSMTDMINLSLNVVQLECGCLIKHRRDGCFRWKTK